MRSAPSTIDGKRPRRPARAKTGVQTTEGSEEMCCGVVRHDSTKSRGSFLLHRGPYYALTFVFDVAGTCCATSPPFFGSSTSDIFAEWGCTSVRPRTHNPDCGPGFGGTTKPVVHSFVRVRISGSSKSSGTVDEASRPFAGPRTLTRLFQCVLTCTVPSEWPRNDYKLERVFGDTFAKDSFWRSELNSSERVGHFITGRSGGMSGHGRNFTPGSGSCTPPRTRHVTCHFDPESLCGVPYPLFDPLDALPSHPSLPRLVSTDARCLVLTCSLLFSHEP